MWSLRLHCFIPIGVPFKQDHGSVQLNIGDVDANGRYTGTYTTLHLCGALRSTGESDEAINRLCIEKKLMHDL